MDFHQLIQTAHGQISLQPISLENNHPIESIQMLDLSQSLKSTILYFADDTIDYKYQKPDRSIQLIAVKKPPEGWLDEHSNLALLTQKDFIPTFNWIHQQIYQSIQMSNHFARLIGMSLRGDSKQDIINTAAQFLQAPLIVIDSGFQILTASNNLPILDTLWAENLQRGYCTYEFIVAVNQITSKMNTPASSKAYEILCPKSPYTKLISKIIWNGTLIGYTIMLTNGSPFEPWQMDLLPDISYVISDMLSKSPHFPALTGSMRSTLLYQLIDGSATDSLAIRMKATGIQLPDYMCCVAMTDDSSLSAKQYDRYLDTQLMQISPNHFRCTYQGQTILLLPLVKDVPVGDQLKPLQDLLGKGVQNIYVSSCFDDFYSCHHYYKQVQSLENLCNNAHITEQFILYDNFRFLDLMQHFNDLSILRTYRHPALELLREYDVKNGTDLYETLKMAVRYPTNHSRAASELYLHRNTMSYRIKKINSLIEIDYDSPDEMFYLTLSFRIDAYLQIIDKTL